MSVYDTGSIVPGELIQVGLTTSHILVVVNVVSRTKLELTSNLPFEVTLTVGVRLIRKNQLLTVYSDPLGQVTMSNPISTAAATGRAGAYLRDARFDYIVSGTGISPSRLYTDADHSGGAPTPFWVNARSFPTIQAAVNSLPISGGVVYIPAGKYVLAAGLVIDKPNVTLEGDGIYAFGESYSTIIEPAEPNEYDLITVNHYAFRLRNVQLNGKATESGGSKSCIVINGAGVVGPLALCTLENVSIQAAPKHGILLRDALSFLATNCEVLYCKGSGIRAEGLSGGSTNVRFVSCQSGFNDGKGIELKKVVNATLLACAMEGNRGGAGEDEGNAIDAVNCAALRVLGCYFENANVPDPPPNPPEPPVVVRAKQFIYLLNCDSAVVESSMFFWGAKAPIRMACLHDASGMRFANNTEYIADNPTIEQLEHVEGILWLRNARGAIQFGNREVNIDQPRIRISGLGLPSLSRNATTVVATDFTTLQLAVDALPAGGGTVYIPEGTYTKDTFPRFVAPLKLPTNRPVRLVGDGPNATILKASDTEAPDADIVQLQGDHQSIEHIGIQGLDNGLSTGRALVIGRFNGDGDLGVPVRHAAVVDCAITDGGLHGLFAVAHGDGDEAVDGVVDGLFVTDAGILTNYTTGVRLGSACNGWRLARISTTLIRGIDHLILDGALQTSIVDSTFLTPQSGSLAAAVRLRDVTSVRLSRCNLLCQGLFLSLPLLIFEGLCAAVGVEQCSFEQTAVPLFDIEIADGATVKDLVLVNPRFEKPGPQEETVEIRVPAPGANGLTELQIVGGSVIFGGNTSDMKAVRVGGYSGSSPYMMMPGSGLRLRLPSLTATDIGALADPKSGDVVFNRTDHRVMFYDPTFGWKALAIQS